MTIDEQAELTHLRAENAALRELVTQLQTALAQTQAQLAAALARIAELEQRPPTPPAFVKPNRPAPTSPKGPRKKRDRRHNTSRFRETPTQVIPHALDRCPDCNYALQGHSLDYTRQIVEIPAPQPVTITEHQVYKRWCPPCGRWHSPRLALTGQVLGQGRMGVRLISLLAYLRTTLRLPVRRIRSYLATIHQLTLSVGAICGLLHRARDQLDPELTALKAQARASPILHADETGWREDGQNGYIWALSTPGPQAVRYYAYDRSRSHVVLKRLLDGRFAGHLVTDFYAAYNDYAGNHQRCWTHLLRDLRELKAAHPEDAVVQAWARDVRAPYDAAQQWLADHPDAQTEMRDAQYRALVRQVRQLALPYAQVKDHPCQTLAKRLLRHEAELFQFVLVPGLDATNNLAERSIRPLVVIRKISGGSRSPNGTKTRMALASLLGTWQARGLNPFLECFTRLSHAAVSPA